MRITTFIILLFVSQLASSQTLRFNQEDNFKIVAITTPNLIKLVNMNIQTFQNELENLGYSYNSNVHGYTNGAAWSTGDYVIEKNNPKQISVTFLHSGLNKTIANGLKSELENHFLSSDETALKYGFTFEGKTYTVMLREAKNIDIVIVSKLN